MERKRFLPKYLAAASAFCLALCLAACGAGADEEPEMLDGPGSTVEPQPVTIGTLATEDILPLWVAEQEGLFQEAGLPEATIQVFQSATELIAAVSAGEVDMAMTDPMVTASIYASGTDVQVEWVTLGLTPDQGRFGIMTADPNISSLEDLAGVPIGVGSNTILEYVMDTLMAQAGVPADQVVKEELQKLPIRYEAMASRQVAAAALPGSLLALGEANGFITVADDTQGENISQSIMIANGDFANSAEGAATIDAVRQAWDQAAELVNASPESYRGLLAEKANLSDAIADSYPICTYPLAQLPAQDMIDAVLEWMQGKGYLDRDISYDAVTGRFAG